MAVTRWLALFLSPLVIASCAAPSDPHSGIGVGSQNGSSRIGISYLRCIGERVTSVELTTYPTTSGPGRTLWRISPGPTAGEATEFTLGQSPPGWLATVPMKELPSKSEKLVVYVDTTKRSPGGISFTIGDLRPDAIMSDDGLMLYSTFVKSRDYC